MDELKILVIDDDEVDRRAVRRALGTGRLAMLVQEVSDAPTALTRLREESFDCALLDYQLPGMDGLTMLRELRRHGIAVPVIMLTGQGNEQIAVQIMKAGAADYLIKGELSLENLSQAVRAAIRIHRAEADARATRDRLEFLARAGEVLGESLDYQQTLRKVAHLAVPRIADWCTVDILTHGIEQKAEPSLQRLVVAHQDSAKARWAELLRRRYPPRPDDRHGPMHVIRTGRSELYPHIPDQMLRDAARDPDHLRLLREVGITSAMVVPMASSSGILGALTFVSAETDHRYGPADLALAEDLARRAATAVENARLYRQAQDALEEAESANRAKDRFLAVLSHELRTPLTPVLTLASELATQPTLPEDMRPVVQMIQRNVELEARLIDDLLDLTRVARGKLQLDKRPTDVHAALANALDICRSEVRARHLNLDVDLAARRHFADADPARVQQVFWNLIKNAVKFTPAGGRIQVRSGNLDGILQVQVIDSGIGIEPQLLPRIFDAFQQGEGEAMRHYGGLGLGLAISKALVEAHDGWTLTADSAGLGKGATFTLRIPHADAAMPPRQQPEISSLPGSHLPQPAAASTPAPRARILLVDDHEDTALALQRLLHRLGHDVKTAHTVAEATLAYERDAFDVLISDIGLPDGNGLDLLMQLLKRRPVKAIALSGFGTEEDVQKSINAGFQTHLTKPVSVQRLEAALGKLLLT